MLKKAVIPMPGNLDEAAQFLAQIGEEQRAIDKVQSDLNTEVDELKTKAMADTKPHQDKIFQLIEGLLAYAGVRRDELTDGGRRKTVETPTGIFCWRMTPPAVSLHNVKSILESLKLLGLNRFIRIKEEIDKEAMLKEPDVAEAVEGVSISQHEEFVVKPAKLEVEITTRVDKLKKAMS